MTEPEDSALSRPQRPADRLREAFRRHSNSTQQTWLVRVASIQRDRPGVPETYFVAVDLTSSDVDALVEVLHGAAELASPDTARRGTNWSWISSGQAANLVGVSSGTLRSWIATNGPRTHPFPHPGVRLPGRNLWRRKVVEKWKAKHDALTGRHQEPGDQPGNHDSAP